MEVVDCTWVIFHATSGSCLRRDHTDTMVANTWSEHTKSQSLALFPGLRPRPGGIKDGLRAVHGNPGGFPGPLGTSGAGMHP